MEGIFFREEPYTCQTCGIVLDAAFSANGQALYRSEGDITFCIKCGTIYTYDADIRICPLTDEQLEEIRKTDNAGFNEIIQRKIAIQLMNNKKKKE